MPRDAPRCVMTRRLWPLPQHATLSPPEARRQGHILPLLSMIPSGHARPTSSPALPLPPPLLPLLTDIPPHSALECVLGDFGHSYVVEIHAESRSSVHQGQGSLYVAPEVTAGSSSSMASDVYSAGRILEQMLAASRHFKEEFAQESKVLVRTLQNLGKDMMHEVPRRRPSSKAASEILARVLPREPTPKAAAARAAAAALAEQGED